MNGDAIASLQEVTDNVVEGLREGFTHADRSQCFDDTVALHGVVDHLWQFFGFTESNFSKDAMTDVRARQGPAGGLGYWGEVVAPHSALPQGPPVDQPLHIEARAVHCFNGQDCGLWANQVQFLFHHRPETVVFRQFRHVA